MTAKRTVRDGVGSERLSWKVQTPTGAHIVDIQPRVMSGSVGVEVDGKAMVRLDKATDARPWSMGTFEFDGSGFLVLLTFAHPVMHVDMFRDGTSLLDGRTIEEARQSLPTPAPAFERWTRPPVTGVSSARIAPVWVLAAIAACVVGLVLGLGTLRSAVLAYVSSMVLLLLFVRMWLILTARAHGYLVTRPDLGDWTRLALLSGAFLAVPAAAGLIFALGLIVVSAL